MTAVATPSGITKYIPILGWLPHYQSAWLRPDLMAGLTAAAYNALVERAIAIGAEDMNAPLPEEKQEEAAE